MSSSPLRILLVEDDELFRLGLVVRLQQEANIEIVAEAEKRNRTKLKFK